MIKITGIVVIAVILASLFSGCTEMSEYQILQKIKEKHESIQDFSATMVMSASFAGNTMSMKAKILNKIPGKSRMEFFEPAELSGQVAVTNGSTLWTYNPIMKQVTKMDVPDDKPTGLDYAFIRELMRTTNISYEGTEKFEGRSVYRLSGSSGNDATMPASRYSMLVDRDTFMPLKIEIFETADEPVISIEYRDIKFNTGIPDSEFEFRVPEGAKVVADGSSEPRTITIDESR